MNLENRKYVVLLTFLTIGVIFLFRLGYMQIVSDKWNDRAKEISETTLPIYAPRGIIYDRNGIKLVENQIYYDVKVIPDEIGEIDTARLCKLFNITREQFDAKIKKARTPPNAGYAPSDFLTQISKEDFSVIRQELYNFKSGFYGVKNPLRFYPRSIAPHVLGYLNEASPTDIETDDYYVPGEYVGRMGIERAYEKELRGVRGLNYILQTAEGQKSGDLNDSRNINPENGKHLICTIDAELQEYGERLMHNKIGSIVAIEPSTGEILAMVSAPTYDPNWIVGKKNRNTYYPQLLQDSLKPLLNRTSYSTYPPGSIFKMIQALVGMNLGKLTPQTTFVCDGSLIGDHCFGTLQMFDAIKCSSNQWFYLAVKRVIQSGKYKSIFRDSEYGLNRWADEMNKFGLGVALPLEIGSGKTGNIPDADYYNRFPGYYDSTQMRPRWAYSTIASISIGQGEVLLTPLQMANLGCILANKGHYYYPHLVKQIGDDPKRKIYREKQIVSEDPSNYDVVIKAMQAVVEEAGGTARRARTKGITVYGKTGTAENPHGEDHSVFLAFARKDSAEIAIAVYVENAKWGGEWAAPISSLMIEKFINRVVTDTIKEQRILDKDFIHPPDEK
jgi:penicillin-binding protein 2